MTKINELFQEELKIINMGLQSFNENLKKQNIKTVQVNWKPPAGGNKKMLCKLKLHGLWRQKQSICMASDTRGLY